MPYYETYGSVRGCCGHRHRSLHTALSCLARDQSGCASQGGYSDRRVRRFGGQELTAEEDLQIEDLEESSP